MGQREKARQIVEERYNMQIVVSSVPDEILAIADRVAGGVTGRRGSFKPKGRRSIAGGGQQGIYELKGPGGLVSIATVAVAAVPAESGTRVTVSVEDFLFQKGPLGMKPTINGASQLDKMIAGLRTELDLLGRAR